jgi:putative ABC transport system ATP-binding protein
MNNKDIIIWTQDLHKIYKMGTNEVHALRGVSIAIKKGEILAIMGPSGSGKSTLMNIIGCLDQPTRGTYNLAGKDVSKMSDDELAVIRNRSVGFIFQNFNLLSRTSALDNVVLPLIYAGVSVRDRRRKAKEVLNAVGLSDRINHTPMSCPVDNNNASLSLGHW